MSYVPRAYPDIVRDMLTTLTGGVVREAVTVPAGDDPVLVLTRLAERPVRRVSHLTGRISVGKGAQAREMDYRFTAADFALVATNPGGAPDAIAFRPGGRRAVPLSTVIVNYYPVDARPAPLTDLNVGSVVRTLLESVAREVAEQYAALALIYDSAFVETATGSSLDRVVALVGAARLPAGHPVATVRFARAAGSVGRITVPAGTAVTDAAGNRYLTTAEFTLDPGEPARTALARGETPATPLAAAGALNRPEVLLAGIGEVTNPDPARALSNPETDDDLRRRATSALHGTVRGTPDALLFAVRSVPGVKALTLDESAGPGIVALTVAYERDTPEVHAEVRRVVDATRAAGIRVVLDAAAPKRVDAALALIVASAAAPADAERADLVAAATGRVTAYLRGLAPGGRVRRAQLASAALADARLVDAAVTLTAEGEAATDEYQLPPGTALTVGTVTVTSVSTESAAATTPTTAGVEIALPVHLVAGVTRDDAQAALGLAVDAYLGTVTPDRPLTVDALLAAVRDDTRYAMVRGEVLVTVTDADRFTQLSDGVGSFAPAPGQTLRRTALNLDVREGTA